MTLALPTKKHVVLSAWHITLEDTYILGHIYEDPEKANMISVRAVENYTWFLHCWDDPKPEWGGLSPAFQHIHTLVLAAGVDLLILDHDEVRNPNLPTFE